MSNQLQHQLRWGYRLGFTACEARRKLGHFSLTSVVAAEQLRTYWKLERPAAPYLFTGDNGKPLDPKPIRKALAKAAAQAGIEKHVTPHVMRNTFATHLLENGTDLRTIQVLLGHASIRSTTIYTRVSATLIARTESPLDRLLQTG